MNPAFKSKYDQMQESQQPETEGEAAIAMGNADQYAEGGHIRNLCFIWPDGKMKFLSYAYLMSGEYLPQENSIQLEFTTDNVRLKGFNLKKLFDLIMLQIAMHVICTDARYNDLNDLGKSIVNDVMISIKV